MPKNVYFRDVMDINSFKEFVENFDKAVSTSENEKINLYFSSNGGDLYSIVFFQDFIEDNIDCVEKIILFERFSSMAVVLVNNLYKKYSDKMYMTDTFLEVMVHKLSMEGNVCLKNTIDFQRFDTYALNLFSDFFNRNPDKESLYENNGDVDISFEEVKKVFPLIKMINYYHG